MLAMCVILFFASALFVDYIDELRKQNKNGKKSK